MLDKPLADVAPVVGRYAGARAFDALSDAQLLEWFITQREEAAFAALVRRHGPMVLSVCRRVLRNSHDAEDAFQATFLVLAKKAHRLRRPELLANWLYGVAYRTALHARQRAARRGERDKEAAKMSAASSDPDPEIEARELRQVLDEELHRLPEKYRAPLVLCYLEGKTNEEAARILGWPTGSMSYRLARGRELLRGRLSGRLAVLPLLLAPSLLTQSLQAAAVSPILARSTAQAAVAVVGAKTALAGVGIISASVRDLMNATLHSLTPSWGRRLFATLLVLLSLLGFGAAVCAALSSGSSHEAAPCNSSP